MMKTICTMAAAASIVLAGALGASAGPGEDSSYTITPAAVASALKSLGYEVTRHVDAEGDPHIIILDAHDRVEEMAVFFDDCGQMGCEDLTFYANMGRPAGASMAKVNAWNHISAQTRSKAFMSGNWEDPDGVIGMSLTASFYTDREAKKIAWLAGIFIIETQAFGAALENE